MLKIFQSLLLPLLFLGLLLPSVKGQLQNGKLNFQDNYDSRLGGPFESSNSRARYALSQAIVRDRTIYLNQHQAAFSIPDLSSQNGKFFPTFMPGISFLAAPFLWIGDIFGAPQLGAYSSTIFFALLNLFLVARISRFLGASKFTSLISGFIFLFATNALVYSQSLTQHHASTTALLVALLISLRTPSFLNAVFMGLLTGVALSFDVPNLLLFAPILVYYTFRHVSWFFKNDRVYLRFNLAVIAALIGLLPPLIFLGWYNRSTVGSPFQLAQFIGRTKSLTPQVLPPESETVDSGRKSSAYDTRLMVNGLYILTVSNERGLFYYSPVLLIGVMGLILAYKKSPVSSFVVLIMAVVLSDLISYSMFGDPWGGWSFGPRYLIPASALVATGIGVALSRFKIHLPFLILFFLLSVSSIYISALGVITSSSIPPKQEAQNLPTRPDYSYNYDQDILSINSSSSLVYNVWLSSRLSATTYLTIYVVLLSLALSGLLFISFSSYRHAS